MTYGAVRVEACRLLKRPSITLTVVQLRIDLARSHEVTRETVIADLQEAHDIALKKGQIMAAVRAIMGQAKIAGLLVDRKCIQLNQQGQEMIEMIRGLDDHREPAGP